MKYKFYVMMNNNNNDNNTSPYTNRNKHNNRPPSSFCIQIYNYNDYFLFFFLLKEIAKDNDRIFSIIIKFKCICY